MTLTPSNNLEPQVQQEKNDCLNSLIILYIRWFNVISMWYSFGDSYPFSRDAVVFLKPQQTWLF